MHSLSISCSAHWWAELRGYKIWVWKESIGSHAASMILSRRPSSRLGNWCFVISPDSTIKFLLLYLYQNRRNGRVLLMESAVNDQGLMHVQSWFPNRITFRAYYLEDANMKARSPSPYPPLDRVLWQLYWPHFLLLHWEITSEASESSTPQCVLLCSHLIHFCSRLHFCFLSAWDLLPPMQMLLPSSEMFSLVPYLQEQSLLFTTTLIWLFFRIFTQHDTFIKCVDYVFSFSLVNFVRVASLFIVMPILSPISKTVTA